MVPGNNTSFTTVVNERLFYKLSVYYYYFPGHPTFMCSMSLNVDHSKSVPKEENHGHIRSTVYHHSLGDNQPGHSRLRLRSDTRADAGVQEGGVTIRP